MGKDISERRKRILRIVVDEYIGSAMPVSSRTIVEHHLPDISSATVRNELAALEDQGFLIQFHTSGGRIPSLKGYRLYIDELMERNELTPEQIGRIKAEVEERAVNSKNVVRGVVEAISELTDLTSVGMSASTDEVIVNVGLFPVGDKALLLLVTDLRIFKDSFIALPEGITQSELADISSYLQMLFGGKKLTEIKQTEYTAYKELDLYRNFMRTVLDAMIAYSEKRDLILSGESRSLKRPEYDDVEKVHDFLSLVQSEERMSEILSDDPDIRIQVRIGSEGVPENCSLVTATYSVGEKQIGTYGVVGPVRMDYAKVVSVLECVGEILESLLKK